MIPSHHAAGTPVNVANAGMGASPIHQAVSQGASDIEMARFKVTRPPTA